MRTDAVCNFMKAKFQRLVLFPLCLLVVIALPGIAVAETIPLSGTAAITGKVLDKTTGLGIPGVTVIPAMVGGAGGGQPLKMWDLAVSTDETGTYTLTSLSPGPWLVTTDDPLVRYPGTYYPNVPDRGAECTYIWASAVQLVAGQTRSGVDITMAKHARVSGRTIDALTGEVHVPPWYGGPDVAVQWWLYDDWSGVWVYTGATKGSWDSEIGPGRYKFKAAPLRSAPYAFGWLGGDSLGEATEFIIKPGESVDVTIPLMPSNVISGVVRAPDRVTPVPNARITVMTYDDVNGLWEDLRPIASTNAVFSGSDGSYQISQLPNGPFRLGAEAPGYAFTFFGDSVYPGEAADITLNPQEVSTTPIVQSTRESTVVVQSGYDVTLAGGGGSISGTVECSDYRALVTVDALTYDASLGAWVSIGGPAAVVPGSDYRLSLPAGDYRIRFRRLGSGTRYNGNAWSVSSAPTLHLATGAAITGVNATLVSGGLSSCSPKAKVVRYGSPAELRVSVRDWRNSPVNGLPVTLQRSLDQKTFTTVARGSSGSYLQAPISAKRTYFRWSFPGRLDTNPPVLVYQTAYVSTPIAPSTMTRNRNYSVYGYLKPRHTQATYPVRIYRWRYVSGKWRSYGYVRARAYDYSKFTKYKRSMSLPYSGRWRLRAYAPEDSKHVDGWSSGYEYVTVR